MRERREIVDLHGRGDAVALATIVGVEGSTYRSPGARMLLAANGVYVGAISGGCLEAEILRKAEWMVRDGAVVERYSTAFDDTTEMPYGLGCGGTVEVLLEPAGTASFEALMQALALSLQGQPVRVRTILPQTGAPMRREIVVAGEMLYSDVGNLSESVSVFDEVLEAPQRLIVCGAGDDAKPLVRIAAELGWTVVVQDGRSQWARADRFPLADKVVASTSLEGLEIGPRDAVVLMTHSYEQDRAWLAAVLPHKPRYVGLLGARHRSALLLDEVAAQLGWPLAQICEAVFAPVGLDLGGEGAEMIALSIVAEIQTHISGKPSSSRRVTPEAVEQQRQSGDALRYIVTECSL